MDDDLLLYAEMSNFDDQIISLMFTFFQRSSWVLQFLSFGIVDVVDSGGGGGA
jgi:hypothetical protein